MSAAKSSLLILLATGTAACLPRGEPPAGRQLVADRQASLAAIVPPNGDGLLRILVMRPGAWRDSQDLSVFSVDADGQASPERLLISDIDAQVGLGCIWRVAPCDFGPTGQASVYVDRTSGGPASVPPGQYSVDPVTGAVAKNDPFNVFAYYSDSRQRSFIPDQSNGGDSGTLTEADGHTTPIQLLHSDAFLSTPYQFIGEDFYYLTPDNQLVDIPPSDVPKQVATGVTGFQVAHVSHDGQVLVVLTRNTSDPAVTQSSILDLSTGAETLLPFDGSDVEISPDGRWAVHRDASIAHNTFTFFDYRAGTTSTVDIPQSTGIADWRPGTSELWMTGYDRSSYSAPDEPPSTPTVWILRPDQPPVSIAGVSLTYVATDAQFARPFTADGAKWFSTATPLNMARQVVQVGAADDPTGPRTTLNAPQTNLEHAWPLTGGRFLIVTNTGNDQRNDVTIVDPQTGEQQALAERGLLAAVGQTRLIGMFHFDSGRGDLTAIELDSLRKTVLAPEFTVTAFAEAQGDDLVAPGARIVYQFQARTDSPYDGIWLVNSP